jgi:hypothetical protein
MEVYEINIVKNTGINRIYYALLSSDYTAIRRANALAGDTDMVKVWKGTSCIFCCGIREDEDPASRSEPMERPAGASK